MNRYAKANGGYRGVKFSQDDPSVDLSMRDMEAKFEKWSLAETRSAGAVTSTAGTTAIVGGGQSNDGDTSSFVNLSSPSPVNSDEFEILDDDDFHEDVPDSHFHQQ